MTESPVAAPAAATPSRSYRAAVANVVLASIVSAFHVGKATIALPSLQHEFGGSLASLSAIMSVFPFVGVFGGIAAGLLVRRWGDRLLLIAGLAMLGAASFAGAWTNGFALLLGTRFAEGLGFVIVVVAAPAVLNRVTPPERRNLVFGLWSTFMPAGIALSMLVGPLLGGWRNGWLAAALLTLVAAAAVPVTTSADTPSSSDAGAPRIGAALRDVLAKRSTTLLALGFATYNVQFFAVMTFLPVFLMQRLGVAVGTAGLIGAAIVAACVIGNLSAGWLLSRGARPGIVMAATSVAIGVAGIGFFSAATPAPIAVALGFAFSAIAGMLPATILASAPGSAPSPSLAPLSIGWVVQGNYLGQVIGPLAIGAIVGAFGWPGGIGLMIAAAAVGAAIGLALLREPTGRR
ncbi:MFS transporter [Burkholderia pseudomultivorans]|uniref:Hexuronate transporter n=1 Tax=Burkholderia pseudomultivorans TaxID=1207504 RepID=A0ABU2DX72_9BURK|nr:MFS transporter [Burkholderia pseudomultivorans]MDR8726395.1 Hexuronate transporter [Burkholderia pseudomultivorans]MDR8733619.1 Hexuronate transporter [Burkholderia pseudomultivorans]MDR8740145.1 Hexuronate transporter [Burkholderia pseudomultivorans]MDR8752187.1 Hexuronate transporter [Burkholderia pseudomultivorans]MDR8776582.1 Hexuronate transporter [Burkholderia pseudomultivorans]